MDFFYQNKNIKYLYVLIAIVYAIGLFIPLMANDSAQHATIAMRMFLNDNFFELFKGPNPYLDKPHMHFWLAALSYKIFGLHEWVYRLPAILFTIVGAYSVYQLTKKLYDVSVAHYGSLIFLTSQSIILANHDVRTDAVLTGAVIFSIWQLFEYVETKKLKAVVLGAIAMGIAFSTKGFYGVGIICFSILSHIIYTKKYNTILSYKVLIGIVTFFITILPVVYAYYVQFGVEGVNFILWNQNVERITATGFKQNSPDYFFFFHSLLWVFLPWVFLMYFGWFYQTKKFIKNKFKQANGIEVLTLGGVFITLFIISFSKFKLPHYLNPLIALLSVFTAGVLYNLHKENKQKTLKVFMGIVYFIVIILTLLAFSILFLTFSNPSILIVIVSVILLVITLLTLFSKNQSNKKKIIISSVLVMVLVNFILNSYFYPELLQYQGGIKLAKIIKVDHSINVNDVYMYEDDYSWTLDFYTQRNTPHISKEQLKNIDKDTWVAIRIIDLDDFKKEGFNIKKIHKVDHFRVTRLSLKFLNPKTRSKVMGDAYLIKVAPQDN
ncbi:ArnT family glycosyltransferase [Tenacibaculum sp. IB213877]|uniref:ArnT family glycosyltransferase n=1 Tax=Tenacibaculum sp. IB213877 TaxID=3097351 RepID=UPI002A5AE27E|nr:glycosyltransferase family 39 protein [Tenacibaculum sp. IB213877]MDY0781350.1 glycosyltransferase family 39 protein [Tenacibaculum sp. IB213877]